MKLVTITEALTAMDPTQPIEYHPDLIVALYDLLQDIEKGESPMNTGTAAFAAWALLRAYQPQLTGNDYGQFKHFAAKAVLAEVHTTGQTEEGR